MTNKEALNLHNEDEVIIKSSNTPTTVIDSYLDDNHEVVIETTYNGFTIFHPDEIR